MGITHIPLLHVVVQAHDFEEKDGLQSRLSGCEPNPSRVVRVLLQQN
jgi:hypothetical protein